MKLSNEWYDFLSMVGKVILPAVAVFYTSLAEIWNLPYAEAIPQTIMAVDLLLNSCLGFSSSNYYKNMAKMVENVENEAIDVESIVHEVPVEVTDDTEQG